MTAQFVNPYQSHAHHAIAFDFNRAGSRLHFNAGQAASGLANVDRSPPTAPNLNLSARQRSCFRHRDFDTELIEAILDAPKNFAFDFE